MPSPRNNGQKAPLKRRQRFLIFLRLFLGIARDFWRESRIARRFGSAEARKRMSNRHRRRAIKFRESALSLGGVLIKLGQFLGARADVMPEEYIEELGKLHDEVPPFPSDQAIAVIESEFGKPLAEVFPEFDPVPVAAASLAQVHIAKLPSGEQVAVKIQRPGIDALIDSDLATFSYLMTGVDRFTTWGKQADIMGLVQEFARTMGDELDFYREGHNAERFKANLADEELVFIPSVYWEYTTSGIVTLERVNGIKITDYDALAEASINRYEVAKIVVDSYLHQVLIDGFFHADPHPGNLFVLPGPVVAFVDFGMVGDIPADTRNYIKDIFIGIATRDIERIVNAVRSLGFIRPGANLTPIKNAISWIYEKYAEVGRHLVTYEDLEEIQGDIRTIMYEQPFHIPARYGFLGRAAGTMIGLVTGLDPDFDFIAEIKPYIYGLIRGSASNVLDTVLSEAKSIGQSLLNLPRNLETTLAKAERGELRFRLESTEVTRALNRLTEARQSTAMSIVGASFLLTGTIFYLFRFFNEAYVFLGFAGVFFIGLLASVRRPRRGRPF